MRKTFCMMIFMFLAGTPSIWAQSNTFPNDLGKTVNTPEGLKRVIDSKDPRFVIVDVRPEPAYNKGHIPTAINIPRGFVADIKNPLSKDKYIVLYCEGGLLAPAAGERMLADGYKYVFVWSGMTNWPYELETSK